MDGSRALAWLNLDDASLIAGDESTARAAYKAVVELAPQHRRVAELKAWIAESDAGHKARMGM